MKNAVKSTGPKTPEGKAATRHNATRHGLLSREVLLPGEDEQALKELDERLRAELQPVGELENLLVDRVVSAQWRLRRLGQVEPGIFVWEDYEKLTERAHAEARTYERNMLEAPPETQYGSFTRITDKHKHQEALCKAQEMKARQEEMKTATRILPSAEREPLLFSLARAEVPESSVSRYVPQRRSPRPVRSGLV